MGRARKTLTPEQEGQIEKLASMFLTTDQIADLFMMSKPTLYRIMERQPKIRQLYKKGRATALASVAQSLTRQALNGNLTAQIFVLKTQAHWRETEPEQQELAPVVNIRMNTVPGKKAANG